MCIQCQALEETLQVEREAAVKEVRACAAAVETAAAVAIGRAQGAEVDAQAAISSSKMKV